MTHFEKLISLATEAKQLHLEGKLNLCMQTLNALYEYHENAHFQVMDELEAEIDKEAVA